MDQDFLKLIQENKGIILRICQLYCPDKTDREDLTQEIIYQLWRSGHRYAKERRFSTWMYRVALNVAISFYREGLRKRTLPLSELSIVFEDPFSEPVAGERSALLWNCVQGLKEFDRALILLYFEEKTYKEMSEILGLSETNVATKIGRIKERLKQCILNSKK